MPTISSSASGLSDDQEDLSGSFNEFQHARKRLKLSPPNAVNTSDRRTLSNIQTTPNPSASTRKVSVDKSLLAHVTNTSNSSTNFSSLGVDPWLVASLSTLAIYRPTLIQKACIPQILKGRDCIGGSKTGSGKTVAFAAPILQKWAIDPFGIYALVLTPTRELALQMFEQFKAIAAPQSLKVILIIGGADMRSQAIALSQRPHIVIATPGRLADHLATSGEDTICGLHRVKFVVLDEADRLLASGNRGSMLPAVDSCLSVLPPAAERQTCLFTATVTSEVRALKNMPRPAFKPPVFVHEVHDDESIAVPKSLQQFYLQVPVMQREVYLHILLGTPANTGPEVGIIIFCNRTCTAQLLEHTLRLLDHRATALHSGLSQRERTDNLGRFRANAARVLVATDVASRGLDIPAVELVVNYNVPRDPNDYVHRVGRTARAGKAGRSITMVGQRDVELVLAIEERVGEKMIEYAEERVNIEGRVIREGLKVVGEKKREAMLQIEQGMNVRGKRKRTKLKPVNER